MLLLLSVLSLLILLRLDLVGLDFDLSMNSTDDDSPFTLVPIRVKDELA